MPGVPGVTEVTVVLTETDGRTSLTLTHAGIEADSPGASGWASTLAKLERALAAVS